jgi:hypothetical protein
VKQCQAGVYSVNKTTKQRRLFVTLDCASNRRESPTQQPQLGKQIGEVVCFIRIPECINDCIDEFDETGDVVEGKTVSEGR